MLPNSKSLYYKKPYSSFGIVSTNKPKIFPFVSTFYFQVTLKQFQNF